MNFTRLLAAGRSVMGIKKQPGPYRMNQDHLLPRFDANQRVPAAVHLSDSSGKALEVSSDLRQDDSSPAAPAPEQLANRRSPERKGQPRRNVLFRLMARLIRRRQEGGKSPSHLSGSSARPVQTELSLNTVKVVRNDLADNDAEFVARGQKAAAAASKSAGATPSRKPLGMVWNRLSARLLRQAVQDFNVIQKERGKLLTHASHDGGGANRS